MSGYRFDDVDAPTRSRVPASNAPPPSSALTEPPSVGSTLLPTTAPERLDRGIFGDSFTEFGTTPILAATRPYMDSINNSAVENFLSSCPTTNLPSGSLAERRENPTAVSGERSGDGDSSVIQPLEGTLSPSHVRTQYGSQKATTDRTAPPPLLVESERHAPPPLHTERYRANPVQQPVKFADPSRGVALRPDDAAEGGVPGMRHAKATSFSRAGDLQGRRSPARTKSSSSRNEKSHLFATATEETPPLIETISVGGALSSKSLTPPAVGLASTGSASHGTERITAISLSGRRSANPTSPTTGAPADVEMEVMFAQSGSSGRHSGGASTSRRGGATTGRYATEVTGSVVPSAPMSPAGQPVHFFSSKTSSTAHSGSTVNRHHSQRGGAGSIRTREGPPLLTAVERVKRGESIAYSEHYHSGWSPEKNRLGLPGRSSSQQGPLKASDLCALEEMGGFQPGTAFRGSGNSMRVSSGPLHRPVIHARGRAPLIAHEEAIVSNAVCVAHDRTMSEQSGNKRSMHVRTGRSKAITSPTGSSSTITQKGTPNSMHPIAGMRTPTAANIITASETVVNVPPLLTFTSNFGASSASTHAHHRTTFMDRLSTYGKGNIFAGGKQVAPLVATEDHGMGRMSPLSIGGGAGGGGGGGSGGGGGGGHEGGGGPSHNNKGKVKKVPKSRRDVEEVVYQSKEMREAMAIQGDEDDRDERNFRTNTINALHSIPWDQRTQLPLSGFGTNFFAILSTPRLWEKLDWTIRASLLTVLPTMVLVLEPATANIFPMPTSLPFYAFWITMPTFGGGLRELTIALKGFSMGLMLLMILIAIQPGPEWLSLIFMFCFTLFSSFVAEESKKTAAYAIGSTIMQYIASPKETNFRYIADYYTTLITALAFGVAAFFLPFIRWSSDNARHYISSCGNALSIQVQGICSSFWVRDPLDRDLNLVRLRQLRMVAEKSMEKVAAALEESEYEPHWGMYTSRMQVRFKFCQSMHKILGSMVQVIEIIAKDATLIDTPMCNSFGMAIGDELAVIASAMNTMILKIVDFEHLVTPGDIRYFRDAYDHFQEALSRVREDVILTNESYETDESDVYLGFFMFSVSDLCDVILNFEEDPKPKNIALYALLFFVRDIKSVLSAFKILFLSLVKSRTIPRRMKEAIKLSLCMTIPGIFQVYVMGGNAASPMAGAAIIALIYNTTGAESFHYATGRLLGTVLGSLTSLFVVQIADGRRWVLYIFVLVITMIGAYVQASPGFYALGNSICCSCISIVTQYNDASAAMVRIEQNCFAILLYFAISCTIWPMRANTKVKLGLNVSLRCLRESTWCLLRSLDMPDNATEVTADVSALLKEMSRKIDQQSHYIPGAQEEPTMASAEYPGEAWKKIVETEKGLLMTLSMMRYAYYTFMSSRADEEMDLSVHWVVLRRISPFAKDLSDLIYSTVDLYLLALTKPTVVSSVHLTRLRHGMLETNRAILETYIRTISRKVAGDDDEDDGDDASTSYANGSRSGGLITSTPLYGGSSIGTPEPPTVSRARWDGGANVLPQVSRAQSITAPSNQLAAERGADESMRQSDNGPPTMSLTKASLPLDKTISRADKKKKGYLTYNLTAEEATALRNLLQGRSVQGAGSFVGGSKGRSAGAVGGSNVDSAPLVSMVGTDMDLAATLRKRDHKKSVDLAKQKEDDKQADHEDESSEHDEHSVLKGHSFFKNASFYGLLSRRRNTEDPHGTDLDDALKSSLKGSKLKYRPGGKGMAKRSHSSNSENGDGRSDSEHSRNRFGDTDDGHGPSFDAEANVADLGKTRRRLSADEDPLVENAVVDGQLPHQRHSQKGSSDESEYSHQSVDRSGNRVPEEKKGSRLVSLNDGDSEQSILHDDPLSNISFFDPKRGEFVLTNVDVHSLEAFLFGLRALVEEINNLQEALLEMMHSDELAKKL